MNGISKALINLLRGWPNTSLLPVTPIKSASSIALSDASIYTPGLNYGPEPGYEPLRQQLAKWLTQFYQLSRIISSERICITGGASQNLACLLQAYSDPLYTRNVWIVSPTYFFACRIFEDNGFCNRLRAIPENEEGVDIEFLAKEIHKSEEKARAEGNLRPIFTEKLSRLSNQYYHGGRSTDTSFMPYLHDVYDQLQWVTTETPSQSSLEHAILPRIVDIDRDLEGGPERVGADGFGNAVSNGSFSKIAVPGCRSGWAEGTEKFSYGLSQVGPARSGGAPSQLTATFMASLLESGELLRHIHQTLRPTYAQLALPESLQAEEVTLRARQEEELIIAPGTMFEVSGDEQGPDLKGKVRLCFSWEEEDLLSEGIERLGKVIRRLQDGQRHSQGLV